tara:strand:- start:105 stop:314 length:210 start_codon:yes stop_codon:yes gene_type:complete
MFKVLVTVCMINSPAQCAIIENTEYPVVYETFESCKERALKIGSDVPIYLKGWRAIRWQCKKVNEGKFV